MEKNKLEEWITDFNREIDAAYRYSFPVRDPELQAEAADALESYLSLLDSERLRLRAEEDSDRANLFLGLCCYARSVIQLLKMWLAIRNDDANEAWGLLVGAQESACAAMRAHRRCAAHMVDYSRHLDMLQHVLFPPQQFVSASFVLRTSECSLCTAPFHECDHIAGLPYDGEFCVEIIREVSAVDHVALVDSPHDKRCRVTSFSDGGFDVDSFTLRRTPREKEKDGRTAEAIIMTQR